MAQAAGPHSTSLCPPSQASLTTENGRSFLIHASARGNFGSGGDDVFPWKHDGRGLPRIRVIEDYFYGRRDWHRQDHSQDPGDLLAGEDGEDRDQWVHVDSAADDQWHH